MRQYRKLGHEQFGPLPFQIIIWVKYELFIQHFITCSADRILQGEKKRKCKLVTFSFKFVSVLLLHLLTLNDTNTQALGRAPLDEGSSRRRDLYLKTLDIHTRQTPVLPAGFEPYIPVRERPKTYILDRTATRIG